MARNRRDAASCSSLFPAPPAGAEKGAGEAVAELRVARQLDVVEHGHVPPEEHVLEGPAQAARGDFVWGEADQVLPLEGDAALGRAVDAGDEVEDRGLAGPVRPDEPAYRTGRHAQGVVVHRAQPAEVVGHVLDFQQCGFRRVPGRDDACCGCCVCGHWCLPERSQAHSSAKLKATATGATIFLSPDSGKCSSFPMIAISYQLLLTRNL